MQVPESVRKIIEHLFEVEGGYVNDPADRGGETHFGITKAAARRYGYQGDMRHLPRSLAFNIYLNDYYLGPRFDWVAKRSVPIAAEMTDAGVNMGPPWAVRFLQTALNAFNDQGKHYPDLEVDGFIGTKTMTVLDAYLARRAMLGRRVLLSTLDSLQAARYIELTQVRPANERFAFGWIANRTFLTAYKEA